MNSGLCCWTSESDHVELQTGDARETDAQLKRGSETPHHPVGYDDDDRWEGWEQLLTGPQSMQGSDLSSQLRDAARLEGWLAGWLDSYLEDRLGQLRWSISTSHKSSDSESPGWAVSEAILPALGCAPRRLLGGQRLGSVDPFSCMTHSSFSPNGAGGHGAVADWGGYRHTW